MITFLVTNDYKYKYVVGFLVKKIIKTRVSWLKMFIIYRGFLAALVNIKTNCHLTHKTPIKVLCGWASWPKVFMKNFHGFLGYVSKNQK